MPDVQLVYRAFAYRVATPMAALVAVLLFAQLAAILFIGWYQTDVAQAAEARIAAGAIAEQVKHLDRTALDYGSWDEAYDRLVGGRDAAWGDVNLAKPMIETFSLSGGAVVTPDNQVSYAFAGPSTRPLATADLRDGDLRDLLEDQRRGPDPGVVSDLVLVDGMPALAAVAPLHHFEQTTIPVRERSFLVLFEKLDRSLLSEVSRTFLLPNLAIAPAAAKGDVALRPSPAVALVTRDGTEFGQLTWTGARPGDTLLLFALPLWGVLALGFGGLAFMILRQARSAAILIGDSEHRARHDALTGLPNRVYLMDRLAAECAALDSQNSGFSVFYLDLDGFKAVNDRHGHEAGDRVLREVAARLSSRLPKDAMAARLGGDEFAVLLPGRTAITMVTGLGQTLIRSLERPIPIGPDLTVRISATIGAAIAPVDGHDAQSLLRAADSALYVGKRAGKGRIMCPGEGLALSVA